MSNTIPDWVDPLVTRATKVDGQPPFSDQSLVELRDGRRKLLTIDETAAAVVLNGAQAEAELVVDPDARHQGHGSALLQQVLAEANEMLIWAHGDHPDARKLAEKHGLEPVRTLLQMRASIPRDGDAPEQSSRVGFSAFRPGADDAEWLALNALAFAGHPEQGGLTALDLDARMSEDWFDAGDFLLLRDDDGQLIAFCWLKVEGELGEFYAVGVDPSQQGGGLGRRLVAAGLARLAERGIDTVALYVEGDNEPAVRLYRSFGFVDHTVDVQYRTVTPAR